MAIDERLDKCIRFSTLQMLIEEGRDPKSDKTLTKDCPYCAGYNIECPNYVPYRSVYFADAETV